MPGWDMEPSFHCDSCGVGCEELIEVVTEDGFKGDMGCPAYPATVEAWCPKCIKAGGYLAKVDENPRERGEDDGMEYGDPRDVI